MANGFKLSEAAITVRAKESDREMKKVVKGDIKMCNHTLDVLMEGWKSGKRSNSQ